MIKEVYGDLFSSSADAYAHGCNIEGIMHAGIAKEFRERYPNMFKDYVKRCKAESFRPGTGYLFKNPVRPHIINLATQAHRGAEYKFLDAALAWLAKEAGALGIKSVAMPRIGTGLGGLEWCIVKKAIKNNFDRSPLIVEIWCLSDKLGAADDADYLLRH
jgi:O-acetyl-ADP-ribose deacetylase (regulator of RNase III)